VIKSKPLSKEFSAGFDRIFRKREAQKGGRWIYDTAKKALVPAHLYRAERALDAPILMDRFYENLAATDGTDIGSRRKHRAYMKEKGWTTADDFSQTWAKEAEKRAAFMQGDDTAESRKDRREDISRALYERTR
jgi:hypothetical protein